MAHKAEFYAGLDAFIQASLNLYQAVTMLETLDIKLPEAVSKVLKARCEEWVKAFSNDSEGA